MEIQSGETTKLKRTSVPKKLGNEELDIDKSVKLLQLPRVVGIFPETKRNYCFNWSVWSLFETRKKICFFKRR